MYGADTWKGKNDRTGQHFLGNKRLDTFQIAHGSVIRPQSVRITCLGKQGAAAMDSRIHSRMKVKRGYFISIVDIFRSRVTSK